MTDELYLRYLAVSLFRDAAKAAAPLAKLLVEKDEAAKLSLAAEVFRAVADCGCRTTGEWLSYLCEIDVNPFSLASACGRRVEDHIKAQAESELATFKQLSLISPDMFFTEDFAPAFLFGSFKATYGKLAAFYATDGVGETAHGDRFIFGDGGFTRAEGDGVRLSDLKNYTEEKAEIVKNTENFIKGLPAFHTLLYGDRGTGKSTTVRAIANEYAGKIKTVELDGRRPDLLPVLLSRLSGLKQKYVIFVDDLAFDENDSRAEGFKAALEGSLGVGGNALIYCTSNRRHLFKETDKQNARNRNDEVQAELALFDRFGLVITYVLPGKDEFIDILRQILVSRGIKWREEYASVAELAALKKGGRTPRAAKQIADIIESSYAEKL